MEAEKMYKPNDMGLRERVNHAAEQYLGNWTQKEIHPIDAAKAGIVTLLTTAMLSAPAFTRNANAGGIHVEGVNVGAIASNYAPAESNPALSHLNNNQGYFGAGITFSFGKAHKRLQAKL